MNNKLKVYLASGWFDENQSKDEIKLYELLIKYGFDVFRPRTSNDVTTTKIKDFVTKVKAFQNDATKINLCDFVVAIITWRDSGTVWECGYAYKTGKPILIIDTLQLKKHPNLMLGMCAKLGYEMTWPKVSKKLKKIAETKDLDFEDYYKGGLE